MIIIPNQAGSIGKDDYGNEEDASLSLSDESEVATVTESVADLKLAKLEDMLSQLDEKREWLSPSLLSIIIFVVSIAVSLSFHHAKPFRICCP